MPKIQPKTNDFTKDSFSRLMTKNKGMSANHAKNHKSKSGKESVRRTAEITARSEFTSEGSLTLASENFIADSLSKKHLSYELSFTIANKTILSVNNRKLSVSIKYLKLYKRLFYRNIHKIG
ncbi:MAG: hypothetical protein WKF71_02070 [Pyrinomonadaceae bacterium]